MRVKTCLLVAVLTLVALPTFAQETPAPLTASYDTLAKIILNARKAEENMVRSILDDHYRAANRAMKEENFSRASAQMALFANEGDNAVAGIRKRLIEGGHHHNAAGEEAGIYEPGYVIVTKEAKEKMLQASKDMKVAKDEAAREAAWKDFSALAEPFLTP